MIHEELLHYPKVGLRRVIDLGADGASGMSCRCPWG